MSSLFITNIESPETMAARVADAESLVAQAKDPWARKSAEANLLKQKFIQADVQKCIAEIAMKTNNRYRIGEPMRTEWKTSEAIAAEGIVGIYKIGEGDGNA